MTSKQISNLHQAQSNVIASYNYTDIAEGTGTVIFYLLTIRDDDSQKYVLTNQQISSTSSDNNFRKGIGADPAPGRTESITFDLSPLNVPKTIRGNFYASISYAAAAAESSSVGFEINYIKLYKVDVDSNTTELFSDTNTTASVDIETTSTDGEGAYYITGGNISRTHLKKGEYIRLIINVTATNLSNQGGTGYILTDPAGSEYGGISGASKIYVPFELTEIGQ